MFADKYAGVPFTKRPQRLRLQLNKALVSLRDKQKAKLGLLSFLYIMTTFLFSFAKLIACDQFIWAQISRRDWMRYHRQRWCVALCCRQKVIVIGRGTDGFRIDASRLEWIGSSAARNCWVREKPSNKRGTSSSQGPRYHRWGSTNKSVQNWGV